MRITFSYSGVKTKKEPASSIAWYPPGTPSVDLPELVSFRFTVDIASDPAAASMIAEPVPFAPPPAKKIANPYLFLPDCRTVIPQHVPGVVSEAYIRRHNLQPPFPVIRPAEAEATFVGQKPGILRLNVLGEDGKPAYEVACAAGREEAGPDQWGIGCRLHRAVDDFDLLSDAVNPYSQMNPALIRSEQLHGTCEEYAQWGAKREFKLRGMRLTLQPSDPTFAPGGYAIDALQTIRLTVKVERDVTATSPVAQPSRYISWWVLDSPNACDTVLINPRLKNED
jgi:hypothetical protein